MMSKYPGSFTTGESNRSFKVNLLTNSETKSAVFSCDFCFYITEFKANYFRHMMRHTVIKGNNINSALQFGKKLYPGSTIKQYKCQLCSYSCSSKSHLKRHTLRHSGERPYKCNVCGKGFTTKQNVQTHLYVHSRKLPYTCNSCHEGFKQLHHLQRHQVLSMCHINQTEGYK
ncbi:zinc finger protein 492-like isoform X1 [Stegodyphus dumicola]|uniref:zinc finger protein 492-like isoform X1 n=1 Tax=Stegodyphus dumicola TaxID=202533 RepID=UPI0015B36081|nr:zinc finger protein 492-like isoform X1 [Stegodyphus dumicola]